MTIVHGGLAVAATSAISIDNAHAHGLHLVDAGTPAPTTLTGRLADFVANARFDRPTLVMDLDAVAERYRLLAAALNPAHIHYAVKANPAPQLLARLAAEGSNFDVASRGEIEQ
ncbi:MAG TPA: hypothetical protein DCL95_14755 [Rhodospirillaceae bacterium]|nr:hypothetical protein [Rhodospirillaceae bacterium]